MDLSKRLIITQPMYFSEPSAKCGYCKGVKPKESQFYSLNSWQEAEAEQKEEQESGSPEHYNCTVGFQCESMSLEVYDKLCNNGFRRSGKFLYKPDLLRSCCRLFTIRTQPDQVQLTKELKSCVKRFGKNIITTNNGDDDDAKKKNSQFDYRDKLFNAQVKSDRFHTKFEPAVFTKEKYELFAKYQEQIHNDFKHSESGFKRFLCDSPFGEDMVLGTKDEWDSLNSIYSSSDATITTTKEKPHRLGPAHECYYMDNKLIAIAVLDFLPSGVSSVYFIWDPDFKHWSLGKLSALRELNLLTKLELPYYYLGYYVEDCHKMNYKASYGGELLDIVNLKYVSLSQLKSHHILDGGKLFIMYKDGEINTVDEELPMNESLSRGGVKGFPSMTNIDKLTNIAETIYGAHPNSGVYSKLPQDVEDLRELGIHYTLDSRDNIWDFVKQHGKDDSDYEEEGEDEDESEETFDPRLKFPNVVPGLISLSELRTMVAENKLSELNGSLFLFDLAIQRIRPVFDILEESPQILLMVCNLVRVLGLEMSKQCLVIVT